MIFRKNGVIFISLLISFTIFFAYSWSPTSPSFQDEPDVASVKVVISSVAAVKPTTSSANSLRENAPPLIIAASSSTSTKSNSNIKRLQFAQALQEQLKNWPVTLLVQSNGNLEWKKPHDVMAKSKEIYSNGGGDEHVVINFKHLLPTSNDPLLIDEIFSKITVESHGDSTLRELVKFLINRLKLGELEKKDANMSYRIPKFFSREILATKPNKKNKNHDKSANGFLRVGFRFDFFAESFLEPFEDHQVPRLASSSASSSPFLFFENSNANVVLLSVGSHVAKTLIMEKKIPVDSARMMQEGIIKSIIYPMQDFLLRRILGVKKIIRKADLSVSVSQEHEKEAGEQVEKIERDGSTPTVLDAARSPRADLIVFFMQSIECDAMQQSQLDGFRKMAAFCPQIQKFLEKLHETIESEISGILLSDAYYYAAAEDRSTDSGRDGIHKRKQENPCDQLDRRKSNVLCHPSLSNEDRKNLAGRFIFVGPMHCAGANAAPSIRASLTSGSKRHCSRDGIHLRSKYLRLKLDLLFNVLVNWWKAG